MPISVDIPELGHEVEFPDSMSQDEIDAAVKSHIDQLKPSFQAQPPPDQPLPPAGPSAPAQQAQRIAARLTGPQETVVPIPQSLAEQSAGLPSLIKPPTLSEFQDRAAKNEELLYGNVFGNIEIPTGATPQDELILAPARAAAGAANYVLSPGGALETLLAATPAAPVIFAKWAKDMLSSGVRSIADVKDAMASLIGNYITSRSAEQVQGSTKTPQVDPEAVRRLADDVVNGVVGITGGTTIGAHGITKGIDYASKITPSAKVYGDVRSQPLESSGQMPTEVSGEGVQPQTKTVAETTQIPLEEPAKQPATSLPPSPESAPESNVAPTEAIPETPQEPASPSVTSPVTSEPPELLPVKSGFVRMYHGGSDPRFGDGRDITQYPEYARGYARKNNYPVWYVDVPENAPYMKKAFEEFEGGPKAPYINTIAPGEVMKSAKIFEPPAAPITTPEVASIPSQPSPEPPKEVAPQSSVGNTGATAPLEVKGMGGAAYGEVEGKGNPDIYGVAERVRAERAAAGQTIPIDPGQGVSAVEAVVQGQEILAKDPLASQKAIEAFDNTKAVSYEGFTATRAAAEKAFRDARRIEEKYGTDSEEYRKAQAEGIRLDKISKDMQTEWHKTGMAQQGQTDVDTGSFTSLERAYANDSGKKFTPGQKSKATKLAGKVNKAKKDLAEAQVKLDQTIKQKSEAMTDAEKRAFDAANRTVREAAARLAKAESKSRVANTESSKAVAKIQEDAARKSLDAANKVVKDMARKAASSEVKDRVARADFPRYVWSKAREYINQGMDNLDEIRNKLATDLGVSVDKVTKALGHDKYVKRTMDDVWKKQQLVRRLDQVAKRWLTDTQMPMYRRAINSVPRRMFGLKVGFHGTVALGTHAPMVLFQPLFWKTYFRDFVKMYKMVGSPAYYERQVQDLLRRPNYILARRAGLINDPFQYEDYNSPDVAQYVGRLSGMGNRGYSVLKVLRQDMFDQMWNKLPKTTQIPEVAQAIADGLNHATGVVRVRAPKGAAVALFAPRLEASRVAWLAVDPIKAADTFFRWKSASEGERMFAMNQLKEKAWVAGTLLSMLAINQGILSLVGSDQKINGIPESLGGGGFDPMESDFLKFKAAGVDVSYGNAMTAMARLPLRLAAAIMYEGKLSKIVLEDERVSKILFDYLRSQMSPFAGTTTDLALGRDFAGRPLPRAGFGMLPGRKDIPKRLRKHGVSEPYTWAEYSLEQFSPIPISEGIKEVWGHGGLGMSDEQQKAALRALLVISIMAGTGARITEDTKK